MKFLIGTACVCIIALTAGVALHAYGSIKAEARASIKAECASVWNFKGSDEELAEIDKMSESEKRQALAKVERCMGYLKTGF